MPYALGDPLSAGLAAASGVMAGQQAKKQRDAEMKRQAMLDAQAQADTQARLGMAKSQQDATNAFRTTQTRQSEERLGIERANADRAQGTADAAAAAEADKARRQKLIDTFQGQGLQYPKNWDKMKPEAKIAYLQVRLNAAQKAGDSKTVSNTETEINRVATQAEADRRQADLEKQRGVQNANAAQRIQISIDRGSGRGGGGITEFEKWTHNPDGTPKSNNSRDTSGLDAHGKEQYSRDERIWQTKYLTNPDAAGDPPDPDNSKYTRRSKGGTAAIPSKAKPVMHNGKPYYLHSDGNYYLTP